MLAFELLAKLRLLTLCGQEFYGELEWMGNSRQWNQLAIEEEEILRAWEVKNVLA